MVVLGREVSLGPGYADLIAVEPDGRLVILEIKLRRNAEARRAVVAQILTYAAYLKGLDSNSFEELLRPHLDARDKSSIIEAVRESEQSAEFDDQDFAGGLEESLRAGEFRLVLVLDEAPAELVRLVGYLESISAGIVIDLITVSAYMAGGEEILVPQRVDPEYQDQSVLLPGRRAVKARREVDGSEAFEEAVGRAPEEDQTDLRRLLVWARELEASRLATLRTRLGSGRQILLVWIRGEKAGLASIWNDGGAYISLWRSVFVRLAWDRLSEVEELIGGPVGQGSTVRNPSPELLAALTRAYQDALESEPEWNGRDFYVAFGENDQRNWDEAMQYGFISAGGGEWYTKTLRQLETGNRVFAYIPKGRGVGGYVGAGEVIGQAIPATDFVVEKEGNTLPYLEVTKAPQAGDNTDDPKLAEWIVPVKWLATRSREEAIQDSDFFANQNSAVKLTHGYTLKRLKQAFGLMEDD